MKNCFSFLRETQNYSLKYFDSNPMIALRSSRAKIKKEIIIKLKTIKKTISPNFHPTNIKFDIVIIQTNHFLTENKTV